MTFLSVEPVTLGRAAGAVVLALTLAGVAPADGWADGTPSPTPEAVPTPTAAEAPTSSTAVTARPGPTTTMGATATSLAGLSAPVHDILRGPVYNIVTTVESTDNTETQLNSGNKRTVILDSKVLFAEDKATLSKAARGRLTSVARQIIDTSATGTVHVDGYTDNQGSARHGLVLSRQRAAAVKMVLEPMLVGRSVRIVTRGLGEADPRVPNTDKAGRAIPANQAKNRRVEISFTPRR